ncbi:MAG: MaoC family dehydratase N-terminal domain-containing protein [Halioglobus sp.]
MSFNPVSATQIWQWCSAMGDNNPCYLPGDKQIAPPAMMQMWTMRDINDRYAPGSTDAAPYKVFDDMKGMGYPANVAVSYDIQFQRYLREGDRAKHYTTVVNISDKKTTGLGIGFFVTERVEYLTQDENLFAEALITYFQYQPAEKDTSGEPAKLEPAIATVSEPEVASQSDWRPDFQSIDVMQLAVGDTLPELVIPITHKLIVGGAIATQDFISVHHNVPEARAAAMPDIFMNILTTSGLSARYLSDWAGSDSRLKHIKFNLMAPNLPGDRMVMEGEVTAVNATEWGAEVAVAFGGKNRMGYHTKGTATLAVPVTNLPK